MRTTLAILVVSIFLTGCSDPDKQAREVEQTITSWSSAVRFAAERYQLHQVTETYFKQVIDAAQEELPSTRKQVDDLPESNREKPREHLRLLESRVSALEQALGSDPDQVIDNVGKVASTMPVKGGSP